MPRSGKGHVKTGSCAGRRRLHWTPVSNPGMCAALRAVKQSSDVVLPEDELVEHALEFALDADGSAYLTSRFPDLTTYFAEEESVTVTSAFTGNLVCELALEGHSRLWTVRSQLAKKLKLSSDSLRLLSTQFALLQDYDRLYAINTQGGLHLQQSQGSPGSSQTVLILEWLGKKLPAVIAALLPEFLQLSEHAVGHLVVLKLFDLQYMDRHLLRKTITGHIYPLAVDPHGCRVLQKAICFETRDGQKMIANELAGKVVDCMKSPHGNHVIQMCILQMPPDCVAFTYEELEASTEDMAKHPYGSRIFQCFVNTPFRMLAGMGQRLVTAAPELITDRFGNYVLQYWLENGVIQDKRQLLQVVLAQFETYARDKFGSNVVEKSFEIMAIGPHAREFHGDLAVFCSVVLDEPGALDRLLTDRYGNFVVQRMIEYSRGQERVALLARLQEMRAVLGSKKYRNGKHILHSLDKQTIGR